jgi:hypothetical protein
VCGDSPTFEPGRPATPINSEGFGRFSPPDVARYCVIARSSLIESQNHLIDAVDSECIDEETRIKYNALAELALEEVTGLMDYLQSPEALRNARRARERRIARRRVADENGKSVGADPNQELGTKNQELGTENREPRTENRERRTERRSENCEPNADARTENGEPNREHERRTVNQEV